MFSDKRDSALAELYPVLAESRAEFRACSHWNCVPGRVMVVSVGGSDDPLDRSNARTLGDQAAAWIDDERAAVGAVESHSGFYNWEYVCIAPEEVDSDLLAEIIDYAESYADYPVLDESDYSELEYTDFMECLDSEIQYQSNNAPEEFSPEHIARATEYAHENFYGYSDPGYISPEHVTESINATRIEG